MSPREQITHDAARALASDPQLGPLLSQRPSIADLVSTWIQIAYDTGRHDQIRDQLDWHGERRAA